jgi:hypothetical protein
MEPHQTLNAFLPKLRAALVLNGMSDQAAAFTCNAVRIGAQQQAITSLEDAQVRLDALTQLESASADLAVTRAH